MSTFSKPSAVVEIIDDAITAKVRAHVPTDQIYKNPADHWWSDDAATLKLNVAGSVIKTKDGKFFEIFKDKPVLNSKGQLRVGVVEWGSNHSRRTYYSKEWFLEGDAVMYKALFAAKIQGSRPSAVVEAFTCISDEIEWMVLDSSSPGSGGGDDPETAFKYPVAC